MKPKQYGIKILDNILTPTKKYEDTVIDLKLSENAFNGFIPVFFYRHPFFSKHIAEGGTVFNKYSIRVWYQSEWKNEDREKLEYILSRAIFRNGALSARFVTGAIIDTLNVDFGVFFANFCKITISISDGIREKTFSLFDSYYSDDRTDGEVEVIFSRELKRLYATDFLVNSTKRIGLEKALSKVELHSRTTRNVIRYITTVGSVFEKKKYTISLNETVFDFVGIKCDPASIRSIANSLKPVKFSTGDDGLCKALLEYGVGFNSIGNTFSYTERYIPPLSPQIYIDKLEDEISAYLERENNVYYEGSITENKNKMSSNKKPDTIVDYLDFATLELTDEVILIAKKNGFEEDEVEILFSSYKIKYTDKKYKHKSLSKSWGNFLKNHKKWEAESKSTPNSGSPENIVYNEAMMEQSRIFGLDEIEAKELFERFRLNCLSRGGRREWIYVWIDWLTNNHKWKKEAKANNPKEGKQNSWQVRQKLENKHYIAKLISEGIVKMLKANGISIRDVLNGKYNITDVVFESVPIPPYGKETEIIFSFADSTIQDRAIAELLRDPLSKEIETYVDAQLITEG